MVKLINYTPLWVCSDGIRTCWNSRSNSDTPELYNSELCENIVIGEKDKALIDRVGNKNKHSSTLEHLYYNFHITDISRACLQEISRHRIASLSVKSTRYTLKELKNEDQFNSFPEEKERASKYLIWTGNHNVDITTFFALEELRILLKSGISNDIAKYALPEAYKTELAWSINARSLQNFLFLRTDKAALWEIRNLAKEVYDALPEEHKYLFENFVKVKNEDSKTL